MRGWEKPFGKTCFLQQPGAAVDRYRAISSPRDLYPDTTLYITVRRVHRGYHLVPENRVNRVIESAFAVMSSRYR